MLRKGKGILGCAVETIKRRGQGGHGGGRV